MRAISNCFCIGCVLVWAAPAQPPTPAKRALVIGNGDYANLPRVQAFLRNAEAMTKTLNGLGFETESAQNLNLREMQTRIGGFAERIKSGEIAFFYFSGFGMQEQDTNVLVPLDYNPKTEGGLAARFYLLRAMIQQVMDRQPGQFVAVLDAAYELPAPPEKEGFGEVRLFDRTLVSFNATPNSVLKRPSANSTTAFTASLVRQLNTRGLRLLEVFNNVGAAVTGEAQRPHYVSQSVDNVYFLPPAAVKPVEKVVYTKEPPKPGESSLNDMDQLNYVWIPKGGFQMGCVAGDTKCKPEENPAHAVTISQDFRITATEVTISGYQRFLKANPSHKPLPRSKTNYGLRSTELPVTNVTWQDAVDYCAWAGGKLPTEAEWEYAARAGKAGQLYPGSDKMDRTLANYFVGGFERLQKDDPKKNWQEGTPVKTYAEDTWHPWNLFGMAGNVSEWVEDFFNPAAYKQPGPFKDPVERTAAKEHVLRGGSWNSPMEELRSSARDRMDPTKAYNYIGFRCVLPGTP